MKNIIIKEVPERALIFLLLLSLLLLAGCKAPVQEASSKKVLSYQDNYEIIGEEKEELLKNVSETVYETSDRSNPEAEDVVIETVDQEGVQVTVPSGRYEIVGSETGLMTIVDEQGKILLSEIVGYGGVPSITADLNEQHIVQFNGGFDQAAVIPVPTQLSTELTTGIWEVGTDIEAGNYTITGSYGLGYLQIFSTTEDARVYEIVASEFSSSESRISIEDGQLLRITDIAMVTFERE